MGPPNCYAQMLICWSQSEDAEKSASRLWITPGQRVKQTNLTHSTIAEIPISQQPNIWRKDRGTNAQCQIWYGNKDTQLCTPLRPKEISSPPLRRTLTPRMICVPFTTTEPPMPVTSNSHGPPCWNKKQQIVYRKPKKHNNLTAL